MKHVLYKTGEVPVGSPICDHNGEVVLALCKNCGRGEAELDRTPECDLRNVDWDELAEKRLGMDRAELVDRLTTNLNGPGATIREKIILEDKQRLIYALQIIAGFRAQLTANPAPYRQNNFATAIAIAEEALK